MIMYVPDSTEAHGSMPLNYKTAETLRQTRYTSGIISRIVADFNLFISTTNRRSRFPGEGFRGQLFWKKCFTKRFLGREVLEMETCRDEWCSEWMLLNSGQLSRNTQLLQKKELGVRFNRTGV